MRYGYLRATRLKALNGDRCVGEVEPFHNSHYMNVPHIRHELAPGLPFQNKIESTGTQVTIAGPPNNFHLTFQLDSMHRESGTLLASFEVNFVGCPRLLPLGWHCG